jgi:hypothetical protein
VGWPIQAAAAFYAGLAHRLQPGADSLEHLNLAPENSPVPEFEWSRLPAVLGLELLSTLLTHFREQHFLSLIVGVLAGTYNEIGIRQWFRRKRAQLDGRAPADNLKHPWNTTQPGPWRL